MNNLRFGLFFFFLIFTKYIFSQDNLETICGTDDRVPSNYKAVGRIIFTGGTPPATGFLIPDGRIITAGHVHQYLHQGDWIEFNVKLSLSNGEVQYSDEGDRYMIDISSCEYEYYSNHNEEGKDWMVFSVLPNSITGLTPYQAQGEYFLLKKSYGTSNSYYRLIGYGAADGSNNHVQQTSFGNFISYSQNFIKYDIDSKNGCSGSPIIEESTGYAIGVHTTGKCADGYNGGTTFTYDTFWNALNLGNIVTLTVDNNFIDNTGNNTNGYVGISDFTGNQVAPKSITRQSLTNLTLTAISPQTDNQNHQMIWYNGNNPQSDWTRNFEFASNDQSYYFQIPADDDGTLYQSQLRINCKIDQTYLSEFNGNFPGPTFWIVEQNTGQITAPSQQTLNGKTYNFAGWTDDITQPNTRTISPTDNETYNALYKYPFHSNNSTGYNNNDQRKFVITSDGFMHRVYESMGYVWYEARNPNTQVWEVKNGGKRLGNGEGKNPSIDLRDDMVVIVWQENAGSAGSDIKLATFRYDSDIYNTEVLETTLATEYLGYQMNLEPVVVWANNSYALAAWHGYYDGEWGPSEGLVYKYFTLAANSLTLYSGGYIIGSDENSSNPTVSIYKNPTPSSPPLFHFSWSQNQTSVYYCQLNPSGQTLVQRVSSQDNSNYKNLSTYSGYTKNYMPTLAILNDDLARIAWVGERNESGGGEGELNKITIAPPTKKTVFRGINNDYNFWYFGSAVTSASVQSTGDNNYYIVWSGSGGTSMVSNYTAFNPVKSLSASGNQVHVASGSTTSNTYAMMFNNTALPYNFTMSNNLASYYQANKENAGGYVFCGREGVVTKDTAHFYYTIGDVSVDNTTIQFKEINEQTLFNSNEDILSYLETEPFELNNNSTFLYSVQYGLTENASSVFGNDGNVNFKVKLIDAETNQLISMFDDVTYNNENKLPYNSIQYSVNTSGIGNRTVKLVLSIEDNIGCTYSVANLVDASSIMPKAVRQEIGLGENINVTEYDLSQNYPNPFNPSTTIRYAIPKDGMVTLKIYDILGREVKTLVNNFKTKDRYEVMFDASNLASGLYIYEITSGDYKASKKMTLIK